ncbi:MAG: hypothetical protein ACRC2T_13820, partial [Thermoguttaceae bacterium]
MPILRNILSRPIGSFLCVLMLYLTYAYALVPIVLPKSKDLADRIKTGWTSESDDEIREFLSTIFPPGSWEIEAKTFLSKDNLVLLFNESTNIENTVELRPCTVVFLGNPVDKNEKDTDSAADISKHANDERQVLIMQTDGSAKIVFDGEFNPTANLTGKFVDGRLAGNVTIKSGMHTPNPDDDLFVQTKDVAFNDTQIVTTSDIDFRFGKNQGQGRDLTVTLTPSDVTNQKSNKSISNIELRELKRLELNISTDGNGDVFGASNSGSSNKNANSQFERFIITCKRGFKFNPDPDTDVYWIGEFDKDVRVDRENNGSVDQLICDKLTVQFGQKPSDNAANAALRNNDIKSLSNITLSKILARGQASGQPAKIRSPMNSDFVAEGNTLVFDFLRNQIKLTSDSSPNKMVLLSVQGGKQYVRGKAMSYTFRKDGMFGQLIVDKSGEIRGETAGNSSSLTDIVGSNNNGASNRGPAAADNSPRQFSMKWSDRLQAIPDEKDPNQICCELFGTSEFAVENIGKMTAKETKMWFNQKKATASVPIRQTVSKPAVSSSSGGLTRMSTPLVSIKSDTPPSGTSTQNGTPASGGNVNGLSNNAKPFNNSSPKKSGSGNLTEGFSALTPDRMRFKKNVILEAENCVCKVNELQISFKEINETNSSVSPLASQQPYANMYPNNTASNTANNAGIGTAPGGNRAGNSSSRSFLGDSASAGNSKFELLGDLMQMQVQLKGEQAEISQIILTNKDKYVTLVEKSLQTSQEPISVVGTKLRVWNPSTDRTVLQLIGEPKNPAIFKGREIKLTGLNIQVNQPLNTFLCDGGGQLETTLLQLDDENFASSFKDTMSGNTSKKPNTVTVSGAGNNGAVLNTAVN